MALLLIVLPDHGEHVLLGTLVLLPRMTAVRLDPPRLPVALAQLLTVLLSPVDLEVVKLLGALIELLTVLQGLPGPVDLEVLMLLSALVWLPTVLQRPVVLEEV